MSYIGDYAEDSTIRLDLTSHASAGGPIAPSSAFEASDFKIFKNDSATAKTTTNGITVTSTFASITGLHHVAIDTSDDTGDAGFWEKGADYLVVLDPDETVDSQNVLKHWNFSIANRAGVLDYLIETGWSVGKVLRAIAAVFAGKSSRDGNDDIFRDVNDTRDALRATVGETGERTAVTVTEPS